MCLSASCSNVCTIDSITVRKLERSVYFERKNIKNFLLMKIWVHLLEREINLIGRPRTGAKDHAGNFSDRKQTNMFLHWKSRNDRRSERNLCNCVKTPEKNSGLPDGVWTRDLAIPVRCSANWAMKPLTLGAGHIVHKKFNSCLYVNYGFNWPRVICDYVRHVPWQNKG